MVAQPIDSPTPFQRSCVRVDGYDKVTVGAIESMVPQHPFWEKFAGGWEPDTERIYRQYVKPGSTILDVGAWIGSTILFGLACGAGRIVALEPNPQSHASLQKMLAANPQFQQRVELLNLALSDKQEVITMGMAAGESDTSTSGIIGDDFSVQTITFDSLIHEHSLTDIDLVKIDVEGAEVLLTDALHHLSKRPDQVVHLSIHVPFFPEGADIDRFYQAVSQYTVFDDRGEHISHDAFHQRLNTAESHPEWGTQHGNFFELLLLA